MKVARSPIRAGNSASMLLAHAARHHRRSAAGADRNDDIAAIDDGGKNESRMFEVVHHVHRQANRLSRSDIAGAMSPRRTELAITPARSAVSGSPAPGSIRAASSVSKPVK